MHVATKLSSIFNALFVNDKTHFTASPLRDTAPYVILLEDNKKRTLTDLICDEKKFLFEIENVLISSGLFDNLDLPELYYVTKAPLHSKHHYLLTLVMES